MEEEAGRRVEREKEGVVRPVPMDEEGNDNNNYGGGGGEGGGGFTQNSAPQIRNATPQPFSSGPLKLYLQDSSSVLIPAFELSAIAKLHLPTPPPPANSNTNSEGGTRAKPPQPPPVPVGCKLVLLKGTKIARGVVMLEPKLCVVLGGRCEGLERRWKDVDVQGLEAGQ